MKSFNFPPSKGEKKKFQEISFNRKKIEFLNIYMLKLTNELIRFGSNLGSMRILRFFELMYTFHSKKATISKTMKIHSKQNVES